MRIARPTIPILLRLYEDQKFDRLLFSNFNFLNSEFLGQADHISDRQLD